MNTRTDTTSVPSTAIRRGALSLFAAAVVATGLVWSGRAQPLPLTTGAAVFLFLVTAFDLRTGRIPNALTLPGLAAALGLSAWLGGTTGLLAGLAGAAVAFGVLLAPFAARVLGAGDVKAIMVLGALFGAQATLSLILWIVITGGVLAIGVLALRGGLREMLARWAATWMVFRTTRRFVYLRPLPGSAAAGSMPLGFAIALSAIAHNLWGAPWA